jgi:hypothetical protein
MVVLSFLNHEGGRASALPGKGVWRDLVSEDLGKHKRNDDPMPD